MTSNTDGSYVPKTDRGLQRMNLILDAAASLVVEDGVHAVTTNAIAKRAQISIGSLYQYFPNKEQVLIALADKYREALEGILDHALERATTAISFSEQLDGIVDSVVQFEVDNLAFGLIFQSETGLTADALVRELKSRLTDVLSAWTPDVTESNKGLYADICIRIMAALLPLTHEDTQVRPEAVHELKRALKGYLLPLLTSCGS